MRSYLHPYTQVGQFGDTVLCVVLIGNLPSSPGLGTIGRRPHNYLFGHRCRSITSQMNVTFASLQFHLQYWPPSYYHSASELLDVGIQVFSRASHMMWHSFAFIKSAPNSAYAAGAAKKMRIVLWGK